MSKNYGVPFQDVRWLQNPGAIKFSFCQVHGRDGDPQHSIPCTRMHVLLPCLQKCAICRFRRVAALFSSPSIGGLRRSGVVCAGREIRKYVLFVR